MRALWRAWYFPTIEKVLEQGEGDCRARAPVLASVLKAKNIPYQVDQSPVHVWLDYESEQETSIENVQEKSYQRDPETGERRFQVPEISLSDAIDSFWQVFWEARPDGRKALLIWCLLTLVAARVILCKKRIAQ